MDDTEAELTVGLIADPGLPLELAGELRTWLPDRLGAIAPETTWTIQVERLTLPLDDDGGVQLHANAEKIRGRRHWDYLIYLTDLPKYVENEPLLATVNTGYGAAMIVLPSLGIVRRNALRKNVLRSLDALHAARSDRREFGPDASRFKRIFTRGDGDGDGGGDGAEEDGSTDQFATVTGLTGRLLMQAGMVRSNRPWRLVPQLSSSMAAAIATGAFGVFYTSIWSMADYLSPWRLLVISLLSVTVMSTWLILANRLWEHPRGPHRRERAFTYNTATVVTIVTAVSVMYIVLYCVILAGALVVIDRGFISSVLGHDAGMSEYINLAWLAASLGTMAGAVGSSFDDEKSVRQATFSSREYERRQLTLDLEDADDDRAPADS